MEELRDFFNSDVRHNLWDGRLIGLPFLFAIFNFDDCGLKSQEVAEIKNGKYVFIDM